ncbi:hypothetical protein ACTNBL_02485 [Enterococcus villorum]|uniref:Uncharacterized protein n=2 Tax=Enterococcus villorum TaxID=112904 RepID=A0A511IYH4_9ENTE|nr:hypothetical protein [Enterococcus villorum]EOH89808.1 hypothetical protein UAO_01052 [Enterococcus villorum ATCC 700913]EOW78040.1 hypothetical protein I591_00895 [Enterococcus villorum ATCC 700913]GEL90755.1 hypothetical protein EVI01_00920 [Enterococcus villorum]
MKKTGFYFLLLILLIATIYFKAPDFPLSDSSQREPLTITGRVTDLVAAEECFKLLKQSIVATNKKDLDSYIDTLVKDAQEATAKQLQIVFDSYDLKHELLSFQVLNQKKDSLFVVVYQKTINQGRQHYQNHIAQIHYTFLKEKNQWKIQQSFITNTELLDESTRAF